MLTDEMREELQAWVDERPDTMETLCDAIRAALAEIDASRADAMRYRWWTENYGLEHEAEGRFRLYTLIRAAYVGDKQAFDAAIDAAMQGEQR